MLAGETLNRKPEAEKPKTQPSDKFTGNRTMKGKKKANREGGKGRHLIGFPDFPGLGFRV